MILYKRSICSFVNGMFPIVGGFILASACCICSCSTLCYFWSIFFPCFLIEAFHQSPACFSGVLWSLAEVTPLWIFFSSHSSFFSHGSQKMFAPWLPTWIPQDVQGKKLDVKKGINLFQRHNFLPDPTQSLDQQGAQIHVLVQASQQV